MHDDETSFSYCTPGDLLDSDAEYLSPSDYDVLQDLIANAGANVNAED